MVRMSCQKVGQTEPVCVAIMNQTVQNSARIATQIPVENGSNNQKWFMSKLWTTGTR